MGSWPVQAVSDSSHAFFFSLASARAAASAFFSAFSSAVRTTLGFLGLTTGLSGSAYAQRIFWARGMLYERMEKVSSGLAQLKLNALLITRRGRASTSLGIVTCVHRVRYSIRLFSYPL